MNTIQILKIIKHKLFEPKKKIIFNTEGTKILTDLQYYDDKKNINETDLKLLEDSDGWNVADKEYVDSKISELYKFVKTIPPTVPTAPSQLDIMSKTNNVSPQKTIFVSTGIMEGENMIFFNPGLIIKKNWNISDFTLFFDSVIEDELILIVNNVFENKTTQISKIKTTGKQIFSAEAKYKVDASKVIVFQIKMPLKNSAKCSLQITVEI